MTLETTLVLAVMSPLLQLNFQASDVEATATMTATDTSVKEVELPMGTRIEIGVAAGAVAFMAAACVCLLLQRRRVVTAHAAALNELSKTHVEQVYPIYELQRAEVLGIRGFPLTKVDE